MPANHARALTDARMRLLGAVLRLLRPFETLDLHKIIAKARAALVG